MGKSGYCPAGLLQAGAEGGGLGFVAGLVEQGEHVFLVGLDAGLVEGIHAEQQAAARQPMRRDVFFVINSTSISDVEALKVKEIAEYLKKYPEAKVEITSYSDKGTGNATINKRLSDKRASVVKNSLVNDYGISSSRISTESKGDTAQPFEKNDLNRVSICIAK